MARATGFAGETRRPWAPPVPALRRVGMELAVVAAFIAAILATNYALVRVPNVKLLDLMVFVAGYTLGFRRGAAVAVGAWLVYGTFNPWGAAGPLLLGTLMASETVYALAGAGLRRLVSPQRLRALPSRGSLLFVAVALACTLAYDLATNIFTGVTWAQFAGSSQYGRWIGVALFNPGALLFSAVHVGSNLLLFPLLGPALIKGAEGVKERLGWGG
ncbi:MAG: hypothetical protein HYY00_06385 [Chloroflexi bacterium]|nr:hypothetical protein [Chloroflexota bacterium]